jgi:muramoyltetrapeptide carboxypeptidase
VTNNSNLRNKSELSSNLDVERGSREVHTTDTHEHTWRRGQVADKVLRQHATWHEKIKVGICAPASHFKAEKFKPALEFLKKIKIETVINKTIYKKELFTAGTSKERTKDLVDILKQKDIDAVFFARGGYGSAQILPLLEKIDLKKELKEKTLMGFSDLTALFSHLYFKYGKSCFYGPNMVSPYFKNKKLIQDVINNKPLKIKIKVLNKGKKSSIKAPIFGGCLSVLVSLIGTPYLKKLDGHILFIEDTNEAPYKIDRMLNQLYQAGITKSILAIAVGIMDKCETPPITWKEPVLNFAKSLNIPVIYDIQAGHGGFEYAIPLGGVAEINLNKKELVVKP